jgi:hypothetical protein
LGDGLTQEVHDGVRLAQGNGRRRRSGGIRPFDDLDSLTQALARLLLVAGKSDDLVSALSQGRNQCPADPTGCPGDDYPLHDVPRRN